MHVFFSRLFLRGMLAAALAVAVIPAPEAAEPPARIAISEKQMQALGIETKPLQATTSTAHARFPAEIIVAPGKEQVISSPFSGVVLQLFVQQNQAVKAGAPLMRIAGQALGQEQLELLRAASRFALARQALLRDQQLVEEGIVPRRRAEEAKAAYAEGQAVLQQAKAALGLYGMSAAAIEGVVASGKPLDSVTLVAPRAGVLTRVEVKTGQRVEPSSTLLYLTQIDGMWLEVQVPAAQGDRWPVGTPVKISGTSLNARVVSINRVVAAETQTVVLRAAVEGKGAILRPGQMLVAELPAATSSGTSDAWEVPLAAVAYDGKQAYVFVRVADGFEVRAVTVLASAAQAVQVQGRLKAGEHLATSGVVALKAAWLGGKGEK